MGCLNSDLDTERNQKDIYDEEDVQSQNNLENEAPKTK